MNNFILLVLIMLMDLIWLFIMNLKKEELEFLI